MYQKSLMQKALSSTSRRMNSTLILVHTDITKYCTIGKKSRK